MSGLPAVSVYPNMLDNMLGQSCNQYLGGLGQYQQQQLGGIQNAFNNCYSPLGNALDKQLEAQRAYADAYAKHHEERGRAIAKERAERKTEEAERLIDRISFWRGMRPLLWKLSDRIVARLTERLENETDEIERLLQLAA